MGSVGVSCCNLWRFGCTFAFRVVICWNFGGSKSFRVAILVIIRLADFSFFLALLMGQKGVIICECKGMLFFFRGVFDSGFFYLLGITVARIPYFASAGIWPRTARAQSRTIPTRATAW